MNAYAWSWNADELERVQEWNAYFCIAYKSYQGSARDVTTGNNPITILNSYCDGQNISLLFDGNSSTYIQPTGSQCAFDIELPGIWMTSNLTVYWDIAQLLFNWNYEKNNTLSDQSAPIEYSASAKLTSSGNYVEQSLSTYKYSPSSGDRTEDIQYNDVSWNETRYVRINFTGTWGDAFRLNELSLYGSAPTNKIVCPSVTFYYWSFDAFNITMAEFPEVTPILGVFYREFVRDWLNDQLLDGHKPFIKAIRNIAMSPFVIMLVAIAILMTVYLCIFLLEWLLLRIDFYRENPFAKVPLVTTTYDEYDPEEHEIGDFKSTATMNPNYFKSPETTDTIASKKQIELGIVQNIPLREGDKETAAQLYAKSFFRTPTATNSTHEITEEPSNDAPISTSDAQDTPAKSYVRALLNNQTQQKANTDHLE